MNLLELVKLLFFKSFAIASQTGRSCLQRWERVRTTVRDRKTVSLMKSLWRPSGRLYTARSFAGLKNTCYVNFALF